MTSRDGAASDVLDGLVSKLREMAQDRGTLDVAQFRFIGMDEIERAYGPRWPAQKGRIQDVAEEYLRRRVHSSDLLVRGSGGFLVVFGAAAGIDAEVAAQQLTHGLNEFFLGKADTTPAPRLSVSTRSLGVSDLVASFEDVDVVSSRGASETTSRVESAGLVWRFQPVWDARRETLTHWYMAPFIQTTDLRVPGYNFETSSPHPSQLASIDQASLTLSEQVLNQLIARGKQTVVGVSVHHSTLTNLASRSRFLAEIDRLDRSLLRYRVMKIAGIAPGFPRIYLDEIVGLLRARIPNVVIGAAWDEPDFPGLIASGPVAIGATLPAWVNEPGTGDQKATLLRRLKEGAGAAHAARMRFFVEGPVGAQFARQLRPIGIDNVASPLIWPPRDEPDTMLRWPASRLAAA